MRTSKSLPSIICSSLLFLPLAVSNPIASQQGTDWRNHCLSDADAATLVAELESFYVKIDPALATKVLTADFQQLSYSALRPGPGTIPPGDVVSANRAQFITQEEAGGSGVPFTTLNVWHGCDNISFRWLLNITDPSTGIYYEYYGIDVLELEKGSYKIKADYSEFSV